MSKSAIVYAATRKAQMRNLIRAIATPTRKRRLSTGITSRRVGEVRHAEGSIFGPRHRRARARARVRACVRARARLNVSLTVY